MVGVMRGGYRKRSGRALMVGLGAALMCLGSVVPAEGARRLAIAPGYVSGGPFVAGAGAGWVDETCSEKGACGPLDDEDLGSGNYSTLRVLTSGGRQLVLSRQISGVEGGGDQPVDFSFDSALVAGGWLSRERRFGDDYRLSVGPIDQSQTPLVRCHALDGDGSASVLLVDGYLAYSPRRARRRARWWFATCVRDSNEPKVQRQLEPSR